MRCWLSLLLLLLLTTGCWAGKAPPTDPAPPPAKPVSEQPEPIDLPFEPVAVESLTATDAPSELVKVKSFGLQRISGAKDVFVHLYVDPLFQHKPEQGEVIAYLQDGAAQYNLGLVSDYGVAQTSVQAVDLTGDGRAEIELFGPLGSHYEELQVLGFDEGRKEWLRYLKTGSPLKKDLDGDGRAELLAVSKGTVPSYLWIYRWQNGQFAMADPGKVLASESVRLVEDESGPLIEAASKNSARLYRYQQGRLLEQESRSD
ncbi:FG-GAP repeat domain-containing protein [Brevibacillus marinus]|uniref:FG-GAP repeat domain-containing protein n=1 Tax=Brevibacillus marinus TaxID=2496837 RepID=UPI000F821BFC|nr:VCBS repeat-containing protein [Brevibacillus marinus]